MTGRSFRGLFWTLALLGASLDQATKYGVFQYLYNGGYGDSTPVMENTFELVAHYTRSAPGSEPVPQVNHGALFGFLGEYMNANTLFAIVSVAAAVAIIYWSTRRSTIIDRSLCAALGLILAGTMGNLYDRLTFGGVRDFMHFHYRSFDWPVFNLADCCLVCGAFLLLAQAFWHRPEPAAEPAPVAEQPALQQEVA